MASCRGIAAQEGGCSSVLERCRDPGCVGRRVGSGGSPQPPSSEGFPGARGEIRHRLCNGQEEQGRARRWLHALPCCKDQRVRAEHQTRPHPTSQEKSKLWKLVRASTHASEPRHGWYDPRVRLDFQLRSDIRRQRFNEPGCSIYPGRILMKPRCQSTSERNARD